MPPSPVPDNRAEPPADSRWFAPYRAPDVRWGLPDATILLVALALAFGGLHLAAGVVHGVGDGFTVPLLLSLALDLGWTAAIVVIVRRRGSGSLLRDLGLRFHPVDLAIGPGVAVLAKIASAVVAALVLLLAGLSLRGVGTNAPVFDDPVQNLLFGGLLGCIVAPFCEELLFRGLVLSAVRNAILRGGSRAILQPASTGRRAAAAIVAVAVSSVLFAGFHLFEARSFAQGVALFTAICTVGVVHGAIVVVTGRLAPAMIAHAVGNAIAFGLLFAFPHLGDVGGGPVGG